MLLAQTSLMDRQLEILHKTTGICNGKNVIVYLFLLTQVPLETLL